MSISYEATGRTRQKARTREAIVSATRELLAAGAMPSVEQAADLAEVSRATAYRYFPNQRDLLVAVHAWVDEPSLVPPGVRDVATRLDAVVEHVAALTVENETALRAMLKLSLEPGRDREDLVLRRGRRTAWVRDALEPLGERMAPAELERLVTAIAAVIGIEALVWMTDVAGLSTDEATTLMRWSASSLLGAALEGSRQPSRPV